MYWTTERPTTPGFYFVREHFGEASPSKGPKITTNHRTIWSLDADGHWWDGRCHIVDIAPDTEFAGPIPNPTAPPSCYDCEHCKSIAPNGHTCMAPVPAWTQGVLNDNVPIIEDAEHNATMALHCLLFRRKDALR